MSSALASVIVGRITSHFGVKSPAVVCDVAGISVDVLNSSALENVLCEIVTAISTGSTDSMRITSAVFESVIVQHLPKSAQTAVMLAIKALPLLAIAAMPYSAIPAASISKVVGSNTSAFVKDSIGSACQAASVAVNKYNWQGVDDDIKADEYSLRAGKDGAKGGVLKHTGKQCDDDKLQKMKDEVEERRKKRDLDFTTMWSL